MTFARLLEIVGDEPVFETGLLLAGDLDPRDVRRQLSRWLAGGRLYQLRRGLYALAPPYQKTRPAPFLIANRLVRPSYVGLQSALSYYDLIPEYVPVTTSVTTAKPGRWDTALGSFGCRHVKVGLFWGYTLADLGGDQSAFLATPEKALLDLLYLEPGSGSHAYLRELRLQNLDRLDLEALTGQAARTGSRKLARAVTVVRELAQAEAEEYTPL